MCVVVGAGRDAWFLSQQECVGSDVCGDNSLPVTADFIQYTYFAIVADSSGPWNKHVAPDCRLW